MNDHILLVDDDKSILDGFEEILRANDYSVSKAQNEKEAISHISNQNCKAVIVDLVLGQESGLDLINTIQELSKDSAIIVITGFPSVETAKESFKRGAYEYLEKPCEKDKLVDTIKRAIDRKKADAEFKILKKQREALDNLLCLDNEDLGARIRSVYSQMSIIVQGADKFANSPLANVKNEYIHLVKLIALMAQNTLKKFIFNGLNILVVDNDLLALSSVNKELTDLGCIVTLSNSSEEARERLLASERFDLCLTEKDLYGIDGIEFTKFIRNEISSQMPIIGMSDLNIADDIDTCLKAGMTRFIQKPIDVLQLKLLMVDCILNKQYIMLDSQ